MNFKQVPGISLGLLFATISLACAALVYTVPNQALSVVGLLIHSSIPITIKPFNVIEILLGAILWFVIGIIVGVLHKKLCETC